VPQWGDSSFPNRYSPILLIYVPGDAAKTGQDGCIEPSKSSDEIRQEPYSLPKEFEWSIIDIDDPKQVTYLVHTTLKFFLTVFLEQGTLRSTVCQLRGGR
jgi:hypothetical protein